VIDDLINSAIILLATFFERRKRQMDEVLKKEILNVSEIFNKEVKREATMLIIELSYEDASFGGLLAALKKLEQPALIEDYPGEYRVVIRKATEIVKEKMEAATITFE
jgi:RecA-family ATPase